MNKKNYYLLICLLFCSVILQGQSLSSVLKKRPSVYGGFESRNSFVQGATADLSGLKVGLSFDNTIKFSFARYKLISDIVEVKKVRLANLQDTLVRANLQLLYYAPGVEYIIYKKDPWQVSIPVEIGIGKSYFTYFVSKGKKDRAFESGILLIEPGISGHYKVMRWVGVGFGIGYRAMLKNNPDIDTRVSNFTFSIGVKLFFSEIIDSIWPREIKVSK
ncbi:MAG: hypothetical protein IPO27_17615 [Bacteroidetes bacterium]|nr:hypothetical protein [Bacteroidota bacterium]